MKIRRQRRWIKVWTTVAAQFKKMTLMKTNWMFKRKLLSSSSILSNTRLYIIYFQADEDQCVGATSSTGWGNSCQLDQHSSNFNGYISSATFLASRAIIESFKFKPKYLYSCHQTDSDGTFEANLSWRRNTGSSMSNISLSSGMASMSSVCPCAKKKCNLNICLWMQYSFYSRHICYTY